MSTANTIGVIDYAAVRAVDGGTGQVGYLHHGGAFVGSDDAWIMPAEQAVAEAKRLARSANIQPGSVELVNVVGGMIDPSKARLLSDFLDDENYVELAKALQAMPEGHLASALKVLDRDAFQALHAAGIRMSGLKAAHPPRHETNSLSEE